MQPNGLTEYDIQALKSEAALLLHNELRSACKTPYEIKRHATVALIESFIASALGQNSYETTTVTTKSNATNS